MPFGLPRRSWWPRCRAGSRWSIEQDELDLKPASADRGVPAARHEHQRAQLLRRSTTPGAGAQGAAAADDAQLLTTRWQLLVTGKVVHGEPAAEVVADTFTHLAHHRGQLSVYLRLTGRSRCRRSTGPPPTTRRFG